jgi:hypothetical protein
MYDFANGNLSTGASAILVEQPAIAAQRAYGREWLTELHQMRPAPLPVELV